MPPTLLDTFPLRDQRTMVNVDPRRGDQPHETVEDVENAWKAWAGEHGLPVRRRAGDASTQLREGDQTLKVYISGGKWIATCPNCNGGVAGWPYHERGACLDCGTIWQLSYPDEATIQELQQLLARRIEADRNWHPELGGIERVRDTQPEQPTRIVQVDLARLTVEEQQQLHKAGLGKAIIR